jgi:DNA-binding CsgD family transcriptional regulator
VALSLFDPPEMLEAGLQAAARGERYVSPVIAPFLLSPFSGDACRADIARFRRQAMGTPALSVREREVAEWAAAGLSNEEIAERLFLSVTTVKSHLMRAFAKLGIQRRSQLRSALEAVPLAAMKRFPPSDESSADPYETVDIICHTKEGFFVTALF